MHISSQTSCSSTTCAVVGRYSEHTAQQLKDNHEGITKTRQGCNTAGKHGRWVDYTRLPDWQ
jgi:hypothetical protein